MIRSCLEVLRPLKTSSMRARLQKRMERGVSAVEFALIAPVLVVMLFGATEASFMVTVDRKVTLAASTAADLATQDDVLTCPEIAGISAVSRTVFAPYDGTNASVVIAGLVLDGTTPKVEWSRMVDNMGNCSAAPSWPVGTIVSVSPDLFAAGGGGVLMSDVRLVYNSVASSFFGNSLTMNERFYLRPRKSSKICLDGVTLPNC
jgi:Flp pilus assembly protein TadG